MKEIKISFKDFKGTLVDEFDRLGQRFVIRSGSRDFMDHKSRKRKIKNIIKNMRYEEKDMIKIDKEGYEEVLEI